MTKAFVSSWRNHAAIAALVLLAACASKPPPQPGQSDATPIDWEQLPPDDWPQLELVINYDVDQETLLEKCPRSHALVPKGQRVAACALLRFCERRCLVYVSPRTPRLLYRSVEHERAHCNGYDHPGSTSVREAWARAKAQGCGPDMPSRSF